MGNRENRRPFNSSTVQQFKGLDLRSVQDVQAVQSLHSVQVGSLKLEYSRYDGREEFGKPRQRFALRELAASV